jgi:hypothetical protein
MITVMDIITKLDTATATGTDMSMPTKCLIPTPNPRNITIAFGKCPNSDMLRGETDCSPQFFTVIDDE